MNKKNNKKNNKDKQQGETSTIEQDKLIAEVEKYMKITQESQKIKDKDDEAIKKVRNANEEKLENLKKLKEGNNVDKIYEIIIEIVYYNLTNSLKQMLIQKLTIRELKLPIMNQLRKISYYLTRIQLLVKRIQRWITITDKC